MKSIQVIIYITFYLVLFCNCSSNQNEEQSGYNGNHNFQSNILTTQVKAKMEENIKNSNSYVSQIIDGTWYGRMMAFDKEGKVKEGCVCECKLFHDSLVMLDYKQEKFLFNQAKPIVSGLSFAVKQENQHLIIMLVEPVKDSIATNQGYGPKVLNGKWNARIVDVDDNGKIHPKYECECELKDENLLNLKYKKNNLVFDPPLAVNIEIIFEIKHNGLLYNINLLTQDPEFYEKESRPQYQYTKNPNCLKCGKPKENAASSYCNSCETKTRNTCPKCGKQEADAAIYWCSKCQKLKCPRCGENLRSSTFDKYCSDCDLELK